MTNIQSILSNNKNFVSIPLVGNKYCKKKPTNNDKNIKIVKEIDNIYDPKALKTAYYYSSSSSLFSTAATNLQ